MTVVFKMDESYISSIFKQKETFFLKQTSPHPIPSHLNYVSEKMQLVFSKVALKGRQRQAHIKHGR